MRLFSGENYKGEKNYLSNQLKYEIVRTVLMFLLSAAIYLIGYFTTKTNKNLLTIVAILGCLPACKSLVSTIMFIRFKSCPRALADTIASASNDLLFAFDRVFTSYDKNYSVDHLVVSGGMITGLSLSKKFVEEDFIKHLDKYLKAENYKDVPIKIFKDEKKYVERLSGMPRNEITERDEGIMRVLLNISL